jgi:hypothetical protein
VTSRNSSDESQSAAHRRCCPAVQRRQVCMDAS